MLFKRIKFQGGTSMSKLPSYQLIRSHRQSIAIYITKEATLEVRAPKNVSQAEIDRVVASKQDWINKHLPRVKENLANKEAFTLDYNQKVLLQGKEYPIRAQAGEFAGFDGEQFYLPPHLSAAEIKGIMIKLYKKIAKEKLTNRTRQLAKAMAVAPSAIKINSARRRWGTCSNKGSINFSWRLIMADDEVIDYIIVHELAHIKELNHSHKFWRIVEEVLPDYRVRLTKLRNFEKRLASENWD